MYHRVLVDPELHITIATCESLEISSMQEFGDMSFRIVAVCLVKTLPPQRPYFPSRLFVQIYTSGLIQGTRSSPSRRSATWRTRGDRLHNYG
jgi:hypothetical protein